MCRDIFEKSHPFQRHTPVHHIRRVTPPPPPPPRGFHPLIPRFLYFFILFCTCVALCRLVWKGRVVNWWSGEPAINARTLSRQSLPVCHPVPATPLFETSHSASSPVSRRRLTESDRQNYSTELQRVLINSFCEYFNNVFEYSA